MIDDGFDKGLMDLYFWKFKTYLSSVGKYLLDTNWECMKDRKSNQSVMNTEGSEEE